MWPCDSDKGNKAEANVEEWRSENRLPFPEFGPEQKTAMEDTLEYPPRGAHNAPGRKAVDQAG